MHLRGGTEEPSIVTIWALARFVHVLSAMVWVGGQLLLSLLVLPVLRRRGQAVLAASHRNAVHP